MSRSRMPLVRLFMMLAVLALSMPLALPVAARSHEGHTSPTDCEETYGPGWPEARAFVINGDGFHHTARFTFELTEGELWSLGCLEGDDLEIDILISSDYNGGITLSDEPSSTNADYKWADFPSDSDNFITANFKGIEVADLEVGHEYVFEVNFSSEHPLSSDQLLTSVHWVPIEWRAARYEGECSENGTYVHLGVETCIIETYRLSLSFD